MGAVGVGSADEAAACAGLPTIHAPNSARRPNSAVAIVSAPSVEMIE
jgi:hypothetical protein